MYIDISLRRPVEELARCRMALRGCYLAPFFAARLASPLKAGRRKSRAERLALGRGLAPNLYLFLKLHALDELPKFNHRKAL